MARVFELDDPLSKSVGHHTLTKCEKTKHLSRTVTPPKPLPTEWDSHLLSSHLQTCNCCKPSTTPRIRPQESTATPFLSNFHSCLTLETNNPPLTHFQTTQRHTRTYTKYKNLLNTLKRDLKTHSLTIVSADKGPGLILLEQNTTSTLPK